MFQLALARGGLWFFGTVVVVFIFGGPDGIGVVDEGDYSFWEQLAMTTALAVVMGGCITFKTWYDSLDDARTSQKQRDAHEFTERKNSR